MTVPYLGFGAYIGVGIESTYGTAVSRTRWMRPTSIGLARTIRNAVQPDLSGEIDSYAPLFTYSEGEESGGTIEGYLAYNDYVATILLKMAFGACTDAGANPYTHTYVPSKTIGSMTIEQGSKDFAEVFEGCQVNSIEISWEVGRVATISAEIIAETSGGQTTVSSPTFIVPSFSLHNEVGTLSWNSVTSTLKRVKFKLNNNLQRRQQLGSDITAEPTKSGPLDLFLEIEKEKVALTMQTAYIAKTQADATITITKSASAALSITLHNALIESYNDTVGDVGPVMERITLRGYRDASDKGCSLVVTNANATAV